MKRKIVKQGSGAYTISLPISWIRENKIDKESELDLITKGKSIILNSNNSITGGEIKIDVSNLNDKIIYLYINALYAKGIDEISFTSNKDISRQLIEALGNVIGYALVAQKNNTYTIKDVSGTNYPDLDEIFKRVFQMILFFYESSINDIFGKQEETLESLDSRDIEVNKFCLYLQRAVNKKSYDDTINARILSTYSFSLEKVSDEIDRSWRTNLKYKVKKTPELKEIMLLVKQGLEEVFDLYYQFNPVKIDKIYTLRNQVRERGEKLSKKSDTNTIRFIRHIIKLIEEAADLTHLTLMKKLETN
jgi:phosphate uptake regulator